MATAMLILTAVSIGVTVIGWWLRRRRREKWRRHFRK